MTTLELYETYGKFFFDVATEDQIAEIEDLEEEAFMTKEMLAQREEILY